MISEGAGNCKKGSVLSWEYEGKEYALNTCFVAISSKIIEKLKQIMILSYNNMTFVALNMKLVLQMFSSEEC